MPYTAEQIETLLAAKLATLKPYYRNGKVEPKSEAGAKLPEFWPGYNEAIEQKRRLALHIERGADPSDLLRTKAPNQSPEEFKFARDNFRQTTLPLFSDYLNTVGRALSDDNWSMEFNGEATNAPDHPRTYFDRLPNFGSVRAWVRDYLLKVKTLDPMGLVIVLPTELDTVPGEEPGTFIVRPGSEVRPLPHYYPVESVWHYEAQRLAIVQTTERSVVEFNGKPSPTGIVLLVIDEANAWKATQVGKAVDLQFALVPYLAPHLAGSMPATQLKGTPTVKADGRIVWESPYAAAQEPLDLAAIDANNLQLIKLGSVFPHKVMLGEDCDFVDQQHEAQCVRGRITWIEDLENGGSRTHETTCPKCKGTGMVGRMGPLGQLLVRPPQRGQDGETVALGEALYFVSPDTATLDFLRKEVEANTNQARRILHLESERGLMAGGDAATATEKGLDAKATIAFVRPIADQVFDLLASVIDWAASERYADRWEGVAITKPTSYDLRTEADYLAELKAAAEAGIAPALLEAIQWRYIQNRYASDPGTLFALEDIAKADRLFGMGWQQLQAMQQQGTVEPWEIVLHFSALSLFDNLAREDKGFTKRPEADRLAKLKEAAQAITPKPKAPDLASLTGGIV